MIAASKNVPVKGLDDHILLEMWTKKPNEEAIHPSVTTIGTVPAEQNCDADHRDEVVWGG